ncbi:MAG TPA: class I SAM-dependent methyltransferase [Candidatus Omnitrophota bacterium]|nr:class I SAM-dependent methyltransferase [Candidatus Omnitrophota bacterium]
MMKKIWDKLSFIYILSFYSRRYHTHSRKIAEIIKYDENHVKSCIKYDPENNALPGFERYLNNGWYKYMMARYLYGCGYIKGKKVLDSGCGLGWGSYLISEDAASVLGVDNDKSSVEFASTHWRSENLCFKQWSVAELDRLDGNFDIILSYEVMEHLPYPLLERYVEGMARKLNGNGRVIASSFFPNKELNCKLNDKNTLHVAFHGQDTIKNLFEKKGFSDCSFIGRYMFQAKKKG